LALPSKKKGFKSFWERKKQVGGGRGKSIYQSRKKEKEGMIIKDLENNGTTGEGVFFPPTRGESPISRKKRSMRADSRKEFFSRGRPSPGEHLLARREEARGREKLVDGVQERHAPTMGKELKKEGKKLCGKKIPPYFPIVRRVKGKTTRNLN